jgi:hypothetical protein
VPFHAILYDDFTGLTDLGTFDTTYPEWQHGYSISYDANTLGQVVGIASSTEGGVWHFRPFVYDAAKGLQELQRDPAYADPSREWYAVAINDSELIGGHVIATAGQSLPYYWPDAAAAPIPLGMPPTFPYGEIYAVNAAGQMVGIMWNDASVEHAFVFDAALGVRDLNALADPAGGWTFEFARDINDSGQIVGSGTWNGLVRGFVLTPVGLLGQVSGSVRHNLTGAALEGVTVSLYGAAGVLASQAVTDSQGRYTSPLLTAGTYFAVTGNASGFPEQLYRGLPCAPCNPTTGTPVNVVAGGIASGVDFELGPSPMAVETVQWANMVGVAPDGATLEKTAATAWGNGGASSTRALASGEGFAEVTLGDTPGYVMVGLSNGDADQGYADIDFALYTYPPSGRVLVYENGVARASSPYAPGDRFRVSVEAGRVRYRRNGQLIHEAAASPAFPLLVDTSFYDRGARLAAVTLGGALVDVWNPPQETAVWRNAVGVSVSGGDLTKTAATGWGNAGASSTREIAQGGDGYAEFTVPASPGFAMFGLANGDADQGYGDIDYAFYTYPPTGQLMVFENGVYRGQFGPFAAGQALRVTVRSGVVRYSRDGAVLYTSAATPTSPLRIDTALYSVGSVVPAPILAGSLVDVPLSAVPVTWTNLVGVSAAGASIMKTAATAWGNAGASSNRGLGVDGYAEFTVPASPGYAMFGLGNGDTDQGYADIEYAFYTYPPTGQLMVFEKGVYRGQLGAYAAGDKLRVSVESGVVKYWFKGVLAYTSGLTPTFPLRVDTSLYSTGATVQEATLAGSLVDLTPPTEPVAWQNTVGVSVSSTTLTKTAPTAWGNAGASSTRGIPSGSDGYAEFTAPASAGYAMFGLSNGDTDRGYADIDFAFYTYPGTGQLMVFEKGVYRGQFGPYSPGDKLRVSAGSGVVRYWFKGVLVYTSSQTPTFPLRVDTSLYSTGAAVQDATLGGAVVGTP